MFDYLKAKYKSFNNVRVFNLVQLFFVLENVSYFRIFSTYMNL